MKWILICPNCKCEREVKEFVVIDKETLLLECPGCHIQAYFP